MKRKPAGNTCLTVFTLVLFLSVGGYYGPHVSAKEFTEEVVYFIDGTSVRGIIIDIDRYKIRIKQKDDSVIERSTKKIYRFSTDRSFGEIYRQAREVE